MTYKTYIEASLSKFNLLSSEIELILLDNSISESAIVDTTIAKKAIHKSLSIWLPVHSSVSEGGVSESWNIEAVKIYYASLCNELGLDNVISDSTFTIRDRSNLW